MRDLAHMAAALMAPSQLIWAWHQEYGFPVSGLPAGAFSPWFFLSTIVACQNEGVGWLALEPKHGDAKARAAGSGTPPRALAPARVRCPCARARNTVPVSNAETLSSFLPSFIVFEHHHYFSSLDLGIGFERTSAWRARAEASLQSTQTVLPTNHPVRISKMTSEILLIQKSNRTSKRSRVEGGFWEGPGEFEMVEEGRRRVREGPGRDDRRGLEGPRNTPSPFIHPPEPFHTLGLCTNRRHPRHPWPQGQQDSVA